MAARAPRLVVDNPAAPPARPAPRPGAAPLHLAWVRTLRCVARADGCLSAVQAHHVRTGNTGGGMGMKPDDCWTVPLCAKHHYDLHTIGCRTFEARHRLDLRALAEELAAKSPFLNPVALDAGRIP